MAHANRALYEALDESARKIVRDRIADAVWPHQGPYVIEEKGGTVECACGYDVGHDLSHMVWAEHIAWVAMSALFDTSD